MFVYDGAPEGGGLRPQNFSLIDGMNVRILIYNMLTIVHNKVLHFKNHLEK